MSSYLIAELLISQHTLAVTYPVPRPGKQQTHSTLRDSILSIVDPNKLSLCRVDRVITLEIWADGAWWPRLCRHVRVRYGSGAGAGRVHGVHELLRSPPVGDRTTSSVSALFFFFCVASLPQIILNNSREWRARSGAYGFVTSSQDELRGILTTVGMNVQRLQTN